MSDIVSQVRSIANRVAASYGLEIFDVSFRREGPGMVLRVQIDRMALDEHGIFRFW